MKMKKAINFCLVAAVLLIVLCLLPTEAEAAEIIDSGTCGDDLTWTLDSEGTLTISGTGKMGDYSISGYAPWHWCTDSIQTVVIEAGVTSIDDKAFRGCRNLTSITIPDSVTSIGNGAFSGCASLTGIAIPNSMTNIGSSAFSGCSSLEYNAYDGAKYLGNDTNPYLVLVGVDDTSMTTYHIHEDTRIIGGGAFCGCASLTSITIPDSVTSIGDSAFYLCSILTDITIGNGVTRIDDHAFSGCTSLTSIAIPDSVEEIGEDAFYYCTSLISITIPGSVTSIGISAFGYCDLWHVLYTGLLKHWSSLSIGDENEALTSAKRHYDCSGDEISLFVAKDPGCTEKGEGVMTCSICNESTTIALDATGHIWRGATCTAPKTCTVCGETEGEPLEGGREHQWNDGQVTKEPTCAEDGEKTYLCGICGDAKTEPIEKTGEHTYDHDKDDTCNACGHQREVDSGHNLVWAIVIIVVGLGCGAAVVFVRKTRRK